MVKEYENNKEMQAFDEFLLSKPEQENFKKMLARYEDMEHLAIGIGLLKNNVMKVFNYTEFVENAGRSTEKTIRNPKSHAVRNWKNLMNKSGWTWVNENIYLMACNDIICPTTVIYNIMKNYDLKFPKRPIVQKIPSNFRNAMSTLFPTTRCTS